MKSQHESISKSEVYYLRIYVQVALLCISIVRLLKDWNKRYSENCPFPLQCD